MKKYSSGSFIDAALRVYGSEADTITSFPASIIANSGNITPWTIYGNTVQGVSVGEKTANLFDISATDTTNGYIANYYLDTNGEEKASNYYNISEYIDITGLSNITISGMKTAGAAGSITGIGLYDSSKLLIESSDYAYGEGTTKSYVVPSDAKYIRISCNKNLAAGIMLNSGTTALPFVPYGYNLPVVIGSNTTNIYMSDVLRMSSGADPVYDIMSSTGVITRNVDTDGTPLITPTTESFTAPTIATVAGSQSVSFDTTVKPSRAELTYTGWHTHDDKKRSGGAWV